ncbi:MAG: penicillin-binding protein activator [SAR324 cluster bacterium]|nr:penicillin-binding protein activator [SAR324 cluster bacterium]
MFLLQVIIFPILLVTLLSVWNFQTVTVTAHAQSLLSDSEWLEENKDVFGKQELTLQNIPLRPSDLSSTPTVLPESFLIPLETGGQYFSTVPQKPAMPLIEQKDQSENPSGSFLSRLFPWFSSTEQSTSTNLDTASEMHNAETRVEWADSEFAGIKMLITEIERLLISDPVAAREMYEEIEDQLEIDERTRLKVQLLYYLKKWSSAEQLAEVFLSERPESKMASLMFYFLNKSLMAQHKPLSQNLIFRKRAVETLEAKFRSDFLFILSNEAFLEGDLLTAIQYRLEGMNKAKTANVASMEKLNGLLNQVQSPEILRILSENNKNVKWLQKKIFIMELELLAKLKRYRDALGILEQRMSAARVIGDQEELEVLKQIQIRYTNALNVNPRRIGVILPLSSSSVKVSRLAQQTMNGLWLALHANEIPAVPENMGDDEASQENEITGKSEDKDNAQAGSDSRKFEDSWELVVRDSQLNPEITKSLVHELVETERVIAIIGPLARKTSEAAAEEAERLRVPLISLSLTESIPELGEFIFRNNQSWKQEIQELLEYATSELQACRFLILYAKTREGRQKMRLFWDAAVLKGCKVVAVEGFKDEGQKSLVNEFDTFTGKIRRLGTEDKIILKELKEKEVPIHNFDAVFVAVGSGGVKNLSLIFPYSEVYKMRKTTFLGDSGWNDSALPYAPGLRGVKNPLFVDSFFLQSKTPAMQQLLRLHERILYRHQNYIGPTAYTAFAYDTLIILMQLLEDERNQSHRDLRDALLNMQMFPGVTGNLRFDEKGKVEREMQLLTLRRGKIQPLN